MLINGAQPELLPSAGSEDTGYTLTRDFVLAMLEQFKAQKTIHRRFAFQIIMQVSTYLKLQSSQDIIR